MYDMLSLRIVTLVHIIQVELEGMGLSVSVVVVFLQFLSNRHASPSTWQYPTKIDQMFLYSEYYIGDKYHPFISVHFLVEAISKWLAISYPDITCGFCNRRTANRLTIQQLR